MTGWILLAIYIIVIPIWIWFEKKFWPYQKGEYTIDFDGAHEIDEELWKTGVCARAGLWPLCVVVIVMMYPFRLINKLFDSI